MPYLLDKTGVAPSNRKNSTKLVVSSPDYSTKIVAFPDFFYDKGLIIKKNRLGRTTVLENGKDYHLYGKVAGLVADNGARAYRLIVITTFLESDSYLTADMQLVGGATPSPSQSLLLFFMKNKSSQNTALMCTSNFQLITFQALESGVVCELTLDHPTVMDVERRLVKQLEVSSTLGPIPEVDSDTKIVENSSTEREFTFQNTTSAIVQHKLGIKYPNVNVVDTQDRKIIPSEIIYESDDSVRIEFSQAADFKVIVRL
jgi:hypothetical protein